jgi:hypothetical protein
MKGHVMKEGEITLGRMFSFASDNLPEGWEIELRMTRGECSLSLEDPAFNDVQRCHDDMDIGERIHDFVNFARAVESLDPIGWDGKPDQEWGPC